MDRFVFQSTFTDYYYIFYYRIQEPWSEQQVDEILNEVSVAQERLENFIRSSNNSKEIQVYPDFPKIEPNDALGKVVVYTSITRG